MIFLIYPLICGVVFPFPQPSRLFPLASLAIECTILFNPLPPALVAQNGGRDGHPKIVRPNGIQLHFLTLFFTPSLEDAVQNALKNYFPPLESSNARVEFYNKFKREADDYDNDFLKKYGGDLDITLIFVGPPLSSHAFRPRC